jgi:hypothetical protein
MARRKSAHIPLPVLKKRLEYMERKVARRQALGSRQPKNAVPLYVLEHRLARLDRLVERRS